ncbi:MAG: hypothetical protein ACRDQ7_18015 [Haloechinothrix sp.]
MTDNDTPDGEDKPRRGSMRFQDAETTTPRQPTLAEQRARARALEQERQRERELGQKSETRRKVMIGAGVTVGLVGLVAAYYVATPDEVTAVCTDADGTVVENEDYCDEDYVTSQGGHIGPGGFMFLPIGLGGGSYRYNYGGSGPVGGPVSGGSYSKPSNAKISTPSGKTVQRGGFGISGKTGGFGKSGGS